LLRRSLRPLLALLSATWLWACGAGRATDCTANRDCPSPQTCVAGRCVSSGCGPLSASCSSDSDCGLRQTCHQGCCVQSLSTTCTDDVDCASRPTTPICDSKAGACVQCLQDADCGQGKLCTGKVCVAQPGCAKSADCTDPSLPVCDTSAKACVQCLQGSDCKDAAKPVCDGSHKCVAPVVCHSNADCAKPTPVCQTSSGNCVGCLADTDCPQGLLCSAQHTCALAPAGCSNDSDCPANQVCGANKTCTSKACAGDKDCAAPVPRCNTTSGLCVMCLADQDCPNGGTCQPDQTCVAYTGPCRSDLDCTDLAKPHCKLVQGGANVCVQCTQDKDCAADGSQTCTNNQCVVKPTCTTDADCAGTPATPHCKTGTPSACVQCVSDGQCPSAQKCSAKNTCVPVCTAATQATDCAPPTPICKESPTGNSCVACIADADCGDPGKICSSSNTCIPKPPACDPAPACTTNNNCCPGGTVCKTTVTPRVCVQCLVDQDCSNGYLCDTSTNTCQPPPVGAEGQPCKSDGSCNSGLICIDEGGPTPVCRTLCNPYATSDTCSSVGAGKVCEWIDFDATNTFFGFCAAANGHGALGAACDPTDYTSCEWNLLCRPTSAATGVCTKLCDPSIASTCTSGDVCNSIVGAVANGSNLAMGYCGPTSKWGTACTTDASVSGPNCGDPINTRRATANGATPASLYCSPNVLLGENPPVHILGLCQYTPVATTATGGAASDCSTFGTDACRTGNCLSNGPVTCFAGCNPTADCQRDENSAPCTTGNCYNANITFCMDVGFSTGGGVSTVPSCVPRCRNESDCAAAASPSSTCSAQATHASSSWQAWCAPSVGTARAGAKCATGADCKSGVCITGATLEGIGLGQVVPGFAATDGFCLGSCMDPTAGTVGTAGDDCSDNIDGTACTTADTRQGQCASGICKAKCGGTFPACTIGDRCVSGLCDMNECGVVNGMQCDPVAALPLQPPGVFGYPWRGACFGQVCSHDADCAGFSKDASTPRVCAPYKQAFRSTSASNGSCTPATQATDCPTVTSTGSPTGYDGTCNGSSNNPNPGAVYGAGLGLFGANGKCRSLEYALQCAPSLGAAKKGAGAACAASTECKTGHCVALPENLPVEAVTPAKAGVCFGSCVSNTDCAAGTCQAASYLGITGLKTCQP
jgi:hypothetical protein